MGQTRDLFKKFIPREHFMQMGSIKDRNGRDLTEAEDIKKRWQEHTELYKNYLHDQDNHNGMITHTHTHSHSHSHSSQTSRNVKSSGP